MNLTHAQDGTPVLKYPHATLAGRIGEIPVNMELPAPFVIVDFERVGWAYPSGLLLACGIIDQLLAAGVERIEVHGPANVDVQNYCSRMHLAQQFRGQAVRFRDVRMHVSERRVGGLLEVRQLQVENDDQVVERARECLGVILTRRPALTARGEDLFEALEELLSNVQEHSHRVTARVAAQSYHSGGVHLAVSDCGRGIPAALRSKRPSATDAQLVEWSTEPDVSSRIGRGGMGLTRMRDQILAVPNGRMQIRSGAGLLTLGPNDRHIMDCNLYGGTIVALRF